MLILQIMFILLAVGVTCFIGTTVKCSETSNELSPIRVETETHANRNSKRNSTHRDWRL